MGVWIEILIRLIRYRFQPVTPLVGVWIEIIRLKRFICCVKSLPLWECGLKYEYQKYLYHLRIVTPLVGVWIEILQVRYICFLGLSHSPCGSVD